MSSFPALPWATVSQAADPAPALCHHCGQPCAPTAPRQGEHRFCCTGCLTVHNALGASDACPLPQAQVSRRARREYQVLDDPEVLARLVQFQDDATARIVLDLPAIHCATCIQSLEQLPHQVAGISYAEVNFSRRQITLAWRKESLSLSQIATELHRRGYPPAISLATADGPKRAASTETRRLILRLGLS
jgi:Cu+-exporting ATPase